MRHFVALMMLAGLAFAPSACRKQPQGVPKVVVIGAPPGIRDPALGPLSAPDQVLLASVAQGLVSFDGSGNIVSGLAERWTVSADGLSYIFRLASTNWPNGRKVTADQVARVLKREIGVRSKNSLKDAFGSVQDIVAMTDRVIEIRLGGPRPDLLSLLAQPQMAILRNGLGTGPFKPANATDGAIRLSREIVSPDAETSIKEEVLLNGASAEIAVRAFAAHDVDLVLGGTFADLPLARRLKMPRGSLRFDPASGLFGLLPTRADGPLARVDARALLSQAIDRGALVTALDVPGLVARATLLEPGLDGLQAPVQPAWAGIPLDQRRAALSAAAERIFGGQKKTAIRIFVPDGPGADILFSRLATDWDAIGLTVERTPDLSSADLKLVDAVAPSTSPAWFVRQFRCEFVAICDHDADSLMDAARQTPVLAQRFALLRQAAAKVDTGQLFIPLAAPVRWSLVSDRVQNFVGNRYARHTLTDLAAKDSNGQ
jgi:oligopeptide transport system substrate-binding protein